MRRFPFSPPDQRRQRDVQRLTVLLAVAVMLAMMLASSGAASAAVLANGKGGEMANTSAALGIATAIANTMKHE